MTEDEPDVMVVGFTLKSTHTGGGRRWMVSCAEQVTLAPVALVAVSVYTGMYVASTEVGLITTLPERGSPLPTLWLIETFVAPVVVQASVTGEPEVMSFGVIVKLLHANTFVDEDNGALSSNVCN
jgi:hypothetical protein